MEVCVYAVVSMCEEVCVCDGICMGMRVCVCRCVRMCENENVAVWMYVGVCIWGIYVCETYECMWVCMCSMSVCM